MFKVGDRVKILSDAAYLYNVSSSLINRWGIINSVAVPIYEDGHYTYEIDFGNEIHGPFSEEMLMSNPITVWDIMRKRIRRSMMEQVPHKDEAAGLNLPDAPRNKF